MHGLLAEWSLACCELERVRDLVAEVADDQCLAVGCVCWDAGLLLGIVEEAVVVSSDLLDVLVGGSVQFLACIHGRRVDQDVRSYSPRAKCCYPVHDVLP
jgi:hypothetical protein